MLHWLHERFRVWKYVIILVLVVLFGPGLAFTAFAQNGRGGEAALRTGCPLLCCSDINTDIGPGAAISLIIFFVLLVVGLAIADFHEKKRLQEVAERQSKDQREKEEACQRKLAEDALKYPQLQGKKVSFVFDSVPIQGVVISQDEDRITVSYLTDTGLLGRYCCRCHEVAVL